MLAENGPVLALAEFLIRLKKCLNQRWQFFREFSAKLRCRAQREALASRTVMVMI